MKHHLARILACALCAWALVPAPLAAADDFVAQAIAPIRQIAGPFSMRLYEPLRQLGLELVDDGRYETSIDAFRYMQNLVHRNFGVYSPRQMESVQLMMQTYEDMGDMHDANVQHEFLYALARHAYEPDDPAMDAARRHLADWYRNTLRYDKALQLYVRSERYLEKRSGAGANLIGVLRSEAMTLYLSDRCCAFEKLARANRLASGEDSLDAIDRQRLSLEHADVLWLARRTGDAAKVYRAFAGRPGGTGPPELIGLRNARDVLAGIKQSTTRYLPQSDLVYVKQAGNASLHPDDPHEPQPGARGTPVLLCTQAMTDSMHAPHSEELSAYYVDVDITVGTDGRPLAIALNGNAPMGLMKYLRVMLMRSYYRPAVAGGKLVEGKLSFRETFGTARRMQISDEVSSWSRLLTLHACTYERLRRSR